MKKIQYENVEIEIVTYELDILTTSDDGGIDFFDQEGWQT